MAIIITMMMGREVHTRHKVIYRTESFGTFRPTDGVLMMIIYTPLYRMRTMMMRMQYIVRQCLASIN